MFYRHDLPALNRLLVNAIDKIFIDIVNKKIRAKLQSTSREEIAQILINLDYFIVATKAFSKIMTEGNIMQNPDIEIQLKSTKDLKDSRKYAEGKLIKLIDSKVADILETVDLDWNSKEIIQDPDISIVDVAQFLEMMFATTLINLPYSIQILLIFREFDSLTRRFLDILLNDTPDHITHESVLNFEVNIKYLEGIIQMCIRDSNKGDKISIDSNTLPENTYVFHAGTIINNDKQLVTNGGRVIAVSAVADSLRNAVDRAYKAVNCIDFKDKYFRRDIAHRAFAQSTSTKGITYADAGVSVDKGNLFVQKIKDKVKSTRRSGADSDIGGFGGLFDLKQAGYNIDDTLLVAATDGVGTKLIIAQETNIHDTVGIDLVAMNVNDLVVQGAEPLLFLDYFATGKLDIKIASDFVTGVADGCIQSGCALVGGETSEMPGMYPDCLLYTSRCV